MPEEAKKGRSVVAEAFRTKDAPRLYMSMPHDVVAKLSAISVATKEQRREFIHTLLEAGVSAEEVLLLVHDALG